MQLNWPPFSSARSRMQQSTGHRVRLSTRLTSKAQAFTTQQTLRITNIAFSTASSPEVPKRESCAHHQFVGQNVPKGNKLS